MESPPKLNPQERGTIIASLIHTCKQAGGRMAIPPHRADDFELLKTLKGATHGVISCMHQQIKLTIDNLVLLFDFYPLPIETAT